MTPDQLYRRDFRAGILAYSSWGVLPLLFKHVRNVGLGEVMAYRIIFGWAILAIIVAKWTAVERRLRRRDLIAQLAAAILLAINGVIYIWAINHRHVLEISVGYFINPQLNLLAGTLLLAERLSRREWLASGLSALGVILLCAGQNPAIWVSFGLSASFAVYGLVKRRTSLPPHWGLLIELTILLPVAGAYLHLLSEAGLGGLKSDPRTMGLLFIVGAVSVIPFLLFAQAARSVDLSRLAMLQYITPTLQLLLATLVFSEPLRLSFLAPLLLIWVGAFTFWSARWSRRARATCAPEGRPE